MSEFRRQRHNPIEMIKDLWPEVCDANIAHIVHDPSMRKGDFDIIRQCGGDGTHLFVMEMMQKALIGICNRQSYYKPNEPDWSKVTGVKYTVGDIKHVTVYGMLRLKCGADNKYPGQRDRVRMPVKVEWLY